MLAILTAILAVNYADRLVFGVVLQDIKADLALSDTELGFLTGIAFAFFYAVMGIPIARWADRANRAPIIGACTVLWSVAVACCGLAASFAQLLTMRMTVAVGEAGCYAPSLSLIADNYKRSERPKAVSRFTLGIPIALTVGFLAAGWLNELYGWRMTLVAFGLPGLILGPIAWLTIRDPRHRTGDCARDIEKQAADAPGLVEVCARLWKRPAFRHLFLCFSIWGFFGQGILQWQPTFFIRSHGMSTGELGSWFAAIQGTGTLVGTYLGGELATRFAWQDERRQMLGVMTCYALLGLLMVALYGAADHHVAFAAMAATSLFAGMCNGPLFATVQSVVEPRMRATAVSLMYLSTNLIGLGLGPLAVGMLSDAFQPSFGAESLRYALIAFSPGYLWCAFHLWRASRTVAAEIEHVGAIEIASKSRGG
jgi:MFS transporter, Spinster family, sphingosine-1-phosphate transporter